MMNLLQRDLHSRARWGRDTGGWVGVCEWVRGWLGVWACVRVGGSVGGWVGGHSLGR